MSILIILHNIRSVHNVGSIFRTAEAAGIEKVYLTGITPTPVDRFGRTRKDLAKVALGAEKMVKWEQVKNISKLIEDLRNQSFKIVAIEQDRRALDYREFARKQAEVLNEQPRIALVAGNEVEGLSQTILKSCDEIVEIPMRGKKESLNVAVAVGIILFNTRC